MEKALEEKSSGTGDEAKPKKSGVVQQALDQMAELQMLEYQQESWWSILVFWIQELRWRRVFWEKMGRPPESGIKQ